MIVKANMAAAEDEKMTDEEIDAQMSIFILAGMDTTSNALSRILQLLAQHPDVQEKLRAEIVEAQGGDRSDLPYDDLIKLPYLDAVCRETLRLYAPVILSGRVCVDSVFLLLSCSQDDHTNSKLVPPKTQCFRSCILSVDVTDESTPRSP